VSVPETLYVKTSAGRIAYQVSRGLVSTRKPQLLVEEVEVEGPIVLLELELELGFEPFESRPASEVRQRERA
jgi:hypothetical protein